MHKYKVGQDIDLGYCKATVLSISRDLYVDIYYYVVSLSPTWSCPIGAQKRSGRQLIIREDRILGIWK